MVTDRRDKKDPAVHIRPAHATASRMTCGTHLVIALLLAILAFFITPVSAHESPIDHIDRVVKIYIEDGKVHLVYRIRLQERQVFFQLQQMDLDADGIISDAERNAYFKKIANQLTKDLRLEIDGKPMTLVSEHPVRLSPDLSQTYHLTAPLAALPVGNHTGRFVDDFSRTHPGDYLWTPRQINRNGIEVDAVDAPGIERLGAHPAMIFMNLRIVVREVK